MKKEKKEKNIYNLELHEMLKFQDDKRTIEITKVPCGWIYALDYPGWRRTEIVFVPFEPQR